jgi:hypothetical protein
MKYEVCPLDAFIYHDEMKYEVCPLDAFIYHDEMKYEVCPSDAFIYHDEMKYEVCPSDAFIYHDEHTNFHKDCEISIFHGGDYEVRRILRCYAVWLLYEPTFRRNVSPPSSLEKESAS